MSSVTQVQDIPAKLDPAGIPPVEIVYCQMSISTDGDQLSLHMPRRNWVFHNVDIDGLITKLQNPEARKELTPDEIYPVLDTASTCCDITIRNTCYIVLELAGYANWHFCCDAPAVQMADQNDEEAVPDNWGLMHVEPDGQHSEKPVADCQIAFFRVARRAANSARPFNFNVEIVDKNYKRPLALIIDPDTTNTGVIPPGQPPEC